MLGWPTCHAAAPGGPICKCWLEDCGHCLLVMKRCSRSVGLRSIIESIQNWAKGDKRTPSTDNDWQVP